MKTLLVEIRTEELPPKVLWDLADSFPDMLLDALKKAGGVEVLQKKYNAPVFALFCKDGFGV